MLEAITAVVLFGAISFGLTQTNQPVQENTLTPEEMQIIDQEAEIKNSVPKWYE